MTCRWVLRVLCHFAAMEAAAAGAAVPESEGTPTMIAVMTDTTDMKDVMSMTTGIGEYRLNFKV